MDTSFIALEMVWRGLCDERIQNEIGLSVADSFLEIINGKTINYFVNEKSLKPFIDRCAELIIEDGDLLLKAKNNTKKIAKKIIGLAQANYQKINKLSSTEMINLLNDIYFLQSECTYMGAAVAFADILGGITNHLIKIVNKKSTLTYPTHTYTSILATPKEKSLTEQAYANIKTNDKILSKLLGKFFWLNQGYIGRGLTKMEVKKIQTEEKYDEIKSPSYRQLQSELNLNEREKKLFKISQDLIYTKSLRADVRQFLYVILNKIIDRLSKQLSVPSTLLETLSVSELYDIISEKKSIPTNLKNRHEHSVVTIINSNNYHFITGRKADDFLKRHLFKEKIKDKKNIVGQVAQPGKVIGRAKLVFGPQHNDKVQPGDILISTATSPQLLPAMKRAAAFVTDVGGITSHAAIVARELKKPCIVATKYATRLLKDGDRVEVDANHGIVKIL